MTDRFLIPPDPERLSKPVAKALDEFQRHSAEHNDANALVIRDPVERIRQRRDQAFGQAVALLRPIERQDRDAVRVLAEEYWHGGRCIHGSCLSPLGIDFTRIDGRAVPAYP